MSLLCQQCIFFIMKATLQQALTGKSLRNDIFNTFSNRSLNEFSPFLKRSRQRDSRYLPFSSQHTVIRSQMESPNMRTDFSSNKFSPSPPQRFIREGKANSLSQTNKVKIQRIQYKKGSSSKSKLKQKTEAAKASKSKESKSKGKRLLDSYSGSKSNKKISSRGKSCESIKNKSIKSKSHSRNKNSKSKDSRQNLSSIIERESQQRGKNNKEEDKTHKKQKYPQLSDIVCKRIQKMCRQPEKYIRILKNDFINIKYRIQRKKIIELEVVTFKSIPILTVMLDKGNLQCQHIQEKYFKLLPNSKINLFSCVRQVDLENPLRLPKIHVEVVLQDNSVIDKQATIPFTWMHFTSQVRHRVRKSRIITKSYLQNIHLDPHHLRSLSMILPSWKTKCSKAESRIQSQFMINENEFQLIISEQQGIWSMELSGRREERLHRLIQFLYKFLC